MKAVISNRIFLTVSQELKERLQADLTYRIPPRVKGGFPEIIKSFNIINPTTMSIPSGRLDLVPEDYELVDKRKEIPAKFPIFKHKLRDSQQEIHDAIDSSCIINAPVSWGKTFTGIAIAVKLGQKTLVVTHTTMLRSQWEKEIEFTLGITPSIVGGGKVDTSECITVANIQTLVKNLHILDKFGTIIVDEAHHCPASTFTSIIDKCHAKYKIGLSGTLIRKDGKHILFEDCFGKVIFKPEKENCMAPQVLIVDSDISFPGGKVWANRVTELEVYNKDYQRMVRDLADAAAAKGHKVLVVSSRVEFLKTCADLSKRPSVCITGEIKSLDERDRLLGKIATGEAEIIYGTISIFSEGISQNDLSCVILATPINNDSLLTQIIGRIIRLKEGKLTPLIIDLHLKGGPTLKAQARSRMTQYVSNGYPIKTLKK